MVRISFHGDPNVILSNAPVESSLQLDSEVCKRTQKRFEKNK